MLEQLLVWERDAFFMLNGSDSAFLDLLYVDLFRQGGLATVSLFYIGGIVL